MKDSVQIRGFRPRDLKGIPKAPETRNSQPGINPKGIPKSRGQWQEARDIKIASQFLYFVSQLQDYAQYRLLISQS